VAVNVAYLYLHLDALGGCKGHAHGTSGALMDPYWYRQSPFHGPMAHDPLVHVLDEVGVLDLEA